MTDTTPVRAVRRAALGYAWMSLAVLIWAGWLVLTASGRTTSLAVIDLAGLRSVIPAAALAPFLWARRAEVAGLGVGRCLLLSLYGAPFTLCVGHGLTHAPVAHAGALVPGLMPIFAAALGWAFLGDRRTLGQSVSFPLLSCGAVAILLTESTTAAGDVGTGNALFLAGALCWACFTVTIRACGVSPYLATALVGAISAAWLAPVWLLLGLSRMGAAGLPDIAFQAAFQGIVSGLVSLFAFGQALRLLGAKAALLSALTPGVAALLALPVLGQVPDGVSLGALALVVAGLAAAASGPSRRTERPAEDGERLA